MRCSTHPTQHWCASIISRPIAISSQTSSICGVTPVALPLREEPLTLNNVMCGGEPPAAAMESPMAAIDLLGRSEKHDQVGNFVGRDHSP
jgi:hypothetical protein